MNPYAFRGWHLPSYADGANYERNYHMYGSLPSGYFAPSTVYPFNTENQKQHNVDWKLPSSVCSTSSDSSPNARDQITKSGYDGLLYKSNCARSCDSDDPARSSCALSCTCSSPHQQRLNVLDNSWRSADLTGALDFNKTSMSTYQSLCQRGKNLNFALRQEKHVVYPPVHGDNPRAIARGLSPCIGG